MLNIDLKFATLQNPETCPIEELEAQIADLENKVGFFETKQLAIKKFINSVYGALGCKYFVAYNTYMAESITAQGRDLNHFSEISVNEYFEGIFQSNPKITVYYQWLHTDKNGETYTFKSENKPESYYNSGTWVECKSWDAAVKKGKKLTPELKHCFIDNSEGHCDWLQTQVGLWKKLDLIEDRCKTFDISKGKTTDNGELIGKEFEYLNGKTQSMTIGGDTDSIYVELGRIISWCAPKTIYWGVSAQTQEEVRQKVGSLIEDIDKLPADLKEKVLRERARKETQSMVDLWNYSLGPYMKNKYEEYAKAYNCPKNIQELELEKIADIVLYFAKKRYAMSECWKEPSIFLPYMSEVIYKGIEIVKGTTPSYARECMTDFVNYVLHWYGDHTVAVPYENLINKLKHYKKIFMTKSPEEICVSTSISNYENYIASDNKSFAVRDKCPAQVQAAGIYNFFLNQDKYKKYKMKYSPIRSGDKVKWYYTTDETYKMFAFSPGQFPAEIALPIDREIQFEKTILSFCNKVIEIIGYQPLTTSLCFSSPLW